MEATYQPTSSGLLEPATLALREHNDCAVRALAVAANVPYDDAHAFWELHGRKRRCGTFTGRTMPHAGIKEFPELGIRATTQVVGPMQCTPDGKYGPIQLRARRSSRLSLRTFCRKYPTGRYLVCVYGHALAVVDGTVIDGRLSDRRIVKRAYRIEKI